MKTCRVCKQTKPLTQFEPQRRQCLDCRKIYSKVRRAAYYARNREELILKSKLWREQNPERARQLRKAEYHANHELAKEAARKYRAENPAKINAWSRKHQLAKKMRTPNWLAVDDYWMMEEAYELAALRTKMFGFNWHVDHIIPLQGKLVSGLHVPHNLQVIPAKENIRKRNKFVTT